VRGLFLLEDGDFTKGGQRGAPRDSETERLCVRRGVGGEKDLCATGGTAWSQEGDYADDTVQSRWTPIVKRAGAGDNNGEEIGDALSSKEVKMEEKKTVVNNCSKYTGGEATLRDESCSLPKKLTNFWEREGREPGEAGAGSPRGSTFRCVIHQKEIVADVSVKGEPER